MYTLYLSLGSNLGDRQQLLHDAIEMIGERVGTVEAVSNFVETEPWGFVSTKPFINAAIRVSTAYDAWKILAITQQIERELGRSHKSVDGVYHDRTIDIDLLLLHPVGTPKQMIIIDEERLVGRRIQKLTLPHPLMQQREFVMTPLREILVS